MIYNYILKNYKYIFTFFLITIIIIVAVNIFTISYNSSSSLDFSTVLAQTDNSIFKNETTINGSKMDLMVMINPPMLHNANDTKNIVLSFIPHSIDLMGSSLTPKKIDHLDYNITITKDENEIWNKQFHDHDGNLMLEFNPVSNGKFKTEMGTEDPNRSHTTLYVIEGPIFLGNGTFNVLAQVVGIEFKPIPSPISDNFDIQTGQK
ncbi:MAG: hypothetical protein ACR2F1_05165 [Nitrososphaeraceae archaeon]